MNKLRRKQFVPVKFKCPHCGGFINSETNKKIVICPFCGTQMVEYNMPIKVKTINQETGESLVKKFTCSAEINNLLARARFFLGNDQRNKAEEYYNRVLDLDANNINAMNGLTDIYLSYAQTYYYSYILDDFSQNEDSNYVNITSKIVNESPSMKDRVDWIRNKYLMALDYCLDERRKREIKNAVNLCNKIIYKYERPFNVIWCCVGKGNNKKFNNVILDGKININQNSFQFWADINPYTGQKIDKDLWWGLYRGLNLTLGRHFVSYKNNNPIYFTIDDMYDLVTITATSNYFGCDVEVEKIKCQAYID